jgi:hypothetical protein
MNEFIVLFPRPALADHHRLAGPRLVIPPRRPPKQFTPSVAEREEEAMERVDPSGAK